MTSRSCGYHVTLSLYQIVSLCGVSRGLEIRKKVDKKLNRSKDRGSHRSASYTVLTMPNWPLSANDVMLRGAIT
jgi:hypothetical protein